MKNKIYFLGIDIQNDFIDIPAQVREKMLESSDGESFDSFHPALPVPNSWEDALNTANFIKKSGHNIDKLILTMDTHEEYDIAHQLFWVNKDGDQPNPFTIITYDDVLNHVWFPINKEMYNVALKYVSDLKEQNKFPLCIWPTHCRLGSLGHKIAKPLEVAINAWEKNKYARAEKFLKGYYPLTENYGAIEAEIVDKDIPETQKNMKLLSEIEDADILLVGGQALSHCVNITVRQIVEHFGDDYAKKIILLSDTTSAVSGFEDQANDFLNDMKKKGMRILTTNEVFKKD